MPTPPRYGAQTVVGAAVILLGLGFAGVQLVAPPASTANSTQAVTPRPAPRIIEINTKLPDTSRPNASEPKRAAPVKPPDETASPPTPQAPEQGPPPASAAELKRKAQEEAPHIVDDPDTPAVVVGEPRRKSPSRARYPRYDRHAVY